MATKETGLEPARKDQSGALVRIAIVLYGVVLAQSLFNKPQVILHPLHSGNQVAALAMATVFSAAGWEFLGYSLNQERFPYDVRWLKGKNTDTASEEVRFAVDLLIALGYGVVLILALATVGDKAANLSNFYVALSVVYVLQIVSDVLRGHHWEVKSIRSVRAFLGGLFPIVLLVAYVGAEHWGAGGSRRTATNLIFLGITFVSVYIREFIDRADAKNVFEAVSARKTCEPHGCGIKVYLAGPLGFSLPGQDYHKEKVRVQLIGAGFELLDPWDNEGSKDLSQAEQNSEVAEENLRMIDRSEAVFAVLDGSDVDSGTAAEIGYAYAMRKRIIGLRTDSRQTGDNEAATVNLQVEWMIVERGESIKKSLEEAVEALRRVTV